MTISEQDANPKDPAATQWQAPVPVTPSAGLRSSARDLIYARNYRLVEGVPERIQFSRCMVRFLNFEMAKANPDLIWGVQGTTSNRDAERYAAADADFRKLRIYQVDLAYRVPGFQSQESSVTAETAERLGYFHCSRIAAGYRKSLRERMIAWLALDKDPEYGMLASMDFDELIMNRPMLIHRLMAETPSLNVVVHPVYLNGGVTLRIATMRNKPEFIENVFTRFHDEIQTTV